MLAQQLGMHVTPSFIAHTDKTQSKRARELLLQRPDCQEEEELSTWHYGLTSAPIEKAVNRRMPYWETVNYKALVKQNRKCNRILFQ